MNGRTARVLLLGLCWLVSFPAAATAQCGWVLWATDIDKGNISASPVNGYASLVQCQVEQRSWEERETAYQRDRAVTNAARQPGQSHVLGHAVSYRCLPDTIDPRGPKGK